MNPVSVGRPLGSPERRRASEDSLDPLSQDGAALSQRRRTPVRSQPPSQQLSRQPSATPSASRFSVVVTTSPNRASYHTPEVSFSEDSGLNKANPTLSSDPRQTPLKRQKTKAENEAPDGAPRVGRQASKAAKQMINTQYDRKKVFARKDLDAADTPRRIAATGAGETTSNGQPRMGRPKGWKPGMSYAQMRGNLPPTTKKPKSGANGIVKRRGRPPKAPSQGPLELYRILKPDFLSFLCEWKDCKADLQNLETLRRHVNLVHLEEQDYEDEDMPQQPWTCLWGKCGLLTEASTFETYEGMEEHVENKHMVPFAWHMGDGPRCRLPDPKPNKAAKADEDESAKDNITQDGIPAYLRDKNGNQITPSINEQRMEDASELKERKKRLWRLLKARDENLPSEDEEEQTPKSNEEAAMIGT